MSRILKSVHLVIAISAFNKFIEIQTVVQQDLLDDACSRLPGLLVASLDMSQRSVPEYASQNVMRLRVSLTSKQASLWFDNVDTGHWEQGHGQVLNDTL